MRQNAMRFCLAVSLLLVGLLAACQQNSPLVVYVVLSPTPDPSESARATANALTVEAISTAQAGTQQAHGDPSTVDQAATETANAMAINAATASAATVIAGTQAAAASLTQAAQTAASPTPPPPTQTAPPSPVPPTPLPPGFPTPVFADIQVAEQLFERGRMFWLQPTQEIWVLVVTAEGRGTWTVYPDTFTEADPATDPSLVPPAGLLQPERGFGKLWREAPGVREQLGWAVTPEFGYVSRYTYHAGGSVDAAGNYTPGPGYHVLYSLYGEQFRFNEADSTWQLGGG